MSASWARSITEGRHQRGRISVAFGAWILVPLAAWTLIIVGGAWMLGWL